MSRRFILYRGQRCPYGAAFRSAFADHAAAHPSLPHEERVLDEKESAAWERAAIRISPTIVCEEGGAEMARLEGRPLIGLTRAAFRRWAKPLEGTISEG